MGNLTLSILSLSPTGQHITTPVCTTAQVHINPLTQRCQGFFPASKTKSLTIPPAPLRLLKRSKLLRQGVATPCLTHGLKTPSCGAHQSTPWPAGVSNASVGESCASADSHAPRRGGVRVRRAPWPLCPFAFQIPGISLRTATPFRPLRSLRLSVPLFRPRPQTLSSNPEPPLINPLARGRVGRLRR
jgi:hypothetical protein